MSAVGKRKITLANAPYAPADYETVHVTAFQALVRGEADSFQQQLILKWMIDSASGVDQFAYYPTDRDTAFALGRQFVGRQILKMLQLRLNLSTLRRELDHED